jgi:hypothetical protein
MMPEAETLNALITLTPQLASLLGAAQRDELYLAAMMKVVQKTNNWANLPPLSEEDLGQRAMDWQDELEQEIPLERIPDVLRRARRNHKGTYAINLYEMSHAWDEIRAEETVEKAKNVEQAKTENPVLFCANRKEHINDWGEVKIVNFFDTSEEIIVPCKTCRQKAYDAWRERFVAQNKDREVLSAAAFNNLKSGVNPVVSRSETVSLEPKEIAGLCDEHNRLVREITESEFYADFEIIFDDKMKIFRHVDRTDLTYTDADIRQKINDYQQILAEKTAIN